MDLVGRPFASMLAAVTVNDLPSWDTSPKLIATSFPALKRLTMMVLASTRV
jgi:hypothetical protein